MNAQDLRNLLNDSNDKFNIFADRSILSQCNMNFLELLELIKDFLNDEEKGKLFEVNHFKGFSSNIKANIIFLIQDNSIKLSLLNDDELVKSLGNSHIIKIIKSLDDNGIMQILKKKDFLKQNNIASYQLEDIIISMTDTGKVEILSNTNIAKQELKLEQYMIVNITASIKEQESKMQIINLYEFEKHQIANIIKTFPNEGKLPIILDNKYNLKKDNLVEVISSLDVDSLVDFLKNNRQFLKDNNIKPYQITNLLNAEKQLDFVSKFEEVDLTIAEKRQILVKLNGETKKNINTSDFPNEYITAMEMEVNNDFSKSLFSYGKITPKFNNDLEIYRGLDELIYINAANISTEERTKLLQLCQICPEMNMYDNIGLGQSTAREYSSAEIWLESVLKYMNEEWSDIQKVAFIDNAIGKKISYCPDYDTEVFKEAYARALWKIIDSGYGVCNGIAQVEKYIFDRIGIDSEVVSSGNHSFLKLKNIEIPDEEGNRQIGDTILDPTWNLTAHRYGARPENFCRSYEKIRKNDIKADGTDTECHKNDEKLESATLELDEQSLRNIFKSIGVTDRDGNFPIKELIDKAKNIDNSAISTEEKVEEQFRLVTKYCPEFAKCQNSTLAILKDISLNQENLEFNRCVVSRVYEKNDEDKKPFIFVYVDIPESGKKFYFADKVLSQFIELSQKEFEERFECYETDIEKNNGYRLWEDNEKTEMQEELATSSGKIIAEEGDERL